MHLPLGSLVFSHFSHCLAKIYRCTILGKMPKEEDTLKDYLFKDSKKSMVYISSTKKTGYSEIITKYRTISSNKEIGGVKVGN